MKGAIKIVMSLSFSFSILRVAIILGTLQPNPIIIGINDLPLNPIDSIVLSIKTAIRAIYPESSKSEIKKNNTIICGTNTKTEPTPATIPSVIKFCRNGATCI